MSATDRRPVRALSKGNRQRVKVASALVHDPEILVLDEPLNGLDPRQRLHLIDLVRRLAARPGRCVVISSHVLDEVERFGSRILVIAQGRLAAEGDFRAIRDLMDDRPHRLRIATDAAGRFAAGLLEAGVASGVRVTGPESLEVETTDVHGFRPRGGRHRPRPRPRARRGRARSTTTSTASSATWWADDRHHLPRHAADAGRQGPAWPRWRCSGVVGVVIGLAVGLGDVPDRSGPRTNMINAFGLSLYAPVVTLVFASASLGDPAEDGTLVYLWLRPVPALADRRRHLPGHPHRRAARSCWCRSGWRPSSRAPATGSSGARSLSATLAVVAYGGIFTWLGLRVRRALVWGLAYILLWEGFVASAGKSASRLAVRAYTRLGAGPGDRRRPQAGHVSAFFAVIVPIAIGARRGPSLTVRRLRRTEVA